MGDINTQALLDTGANCCLVGQREASKLGLYATDQSAKLVGVGSEVAFRAAPTTLVAAGNSTTIKPYILRQSPEIPLVLGIPVLAALKLHLDFSGEGKTTVCARKHTVALLNQPESVDLKSSTTAKLPPEPLGVVTLHKDVHPEGPDDPKVKTDAFLNALSAAWTPEKDTRKMKDLWTEFADLWSEDDSSLAGGTDSCGFAQVETFGTPHRARVRPLSPELLSHLGPRPQSSCPSAMVRGVWRSTTVS